MPSSEKKNKLKKYRCTLVGRDSAVGKATCYRLDGPGFEAQWGGEIFFTCPDRSWTSLSLLYNGYRVFPVGVKRPGCDVTTHLYVVHRLKKEYSCFPSGPSWPVLG